MISFFKKNVIYVEKFLFVGVFFAIILVFFFNNITHLIDDGISTENRALAQCSNFLERKSDIRIKDSIKGIEELPVNFTNCFNDHFSFRNKIVSGMNYARVAVFNKPAIANVVKGNDDWFFWLSTDVVDTSNGNRRYTPQESNQVKNLLEERSKYLANQNIPYYMLMVPNKKTIYPEYIPEPELPTGTKTVLDDFSDSVSQVPNIHYANLRSDIKQRKATQRVFYTNDSHWNNSGMSVAYNKLSSLLATSSITKLKSIDSFDTKMVDHKGDMLFLLNMFDYYQDKNQLQYYSANPNATKDTGPLAFITLPNGNRVEYEHWTNTNKALPKALLFGDSYTDAMRPLLAENFSELYYIKTFQAFPTDEIAKIKPDVVLSIFNENALYPTFTN